MATRARLPLMRHDKRAWFLAGGALILIVGLLTLAVGGWTVQGVRRAFALPQPA